MIDKLCCYKEIEQDHSGPMQIHYVETLMQKTVKELNDIKSELRGVTIGSLIDENDKSEISKILEKHGFDSIEEYQREVETGGWEESSNPFLTQQGMPTGSTISAFSGNARTMGLKVRAQTLHPRKFNSVKDVEDELLNILMSESKKNTLNLFKKNGVNFDIDSSKIPNQIAGIPSSLERKVMSKIIHLSSLIAVEGRIGPATHILIHPKLTLQYNNINTAGFSLLTSSKIEKNRVYVFRNSDNSNNNQIYVTYNKTLNEYYIGITNAIKNNCFTFEII